MKHSGRLLMHVALLAIVSTAFAQAPKTLSYQGTLSDSSGLLSGSHNLTFAIYDASSGGANLWTETSLGVVVVQGNVSLTLGKLNPINIQTVKPLWMGITVDSNPEISPRVELSASLYSLGLALPYSATVTNGIGNGGQLMNLTYDGDSSVAILRLNYNGTSLSNPFVLNHTGTGASMVVTQSGTLGTGTIFSLTNSANPQPAMRGTTFGTGSAGVFQVSNPANASAAINITHSGTGNAITANRPIQATQFIGDGSLLTGVSGLTLPYSTSVSAINGNTSLFDITYTGDSSVNIVRLNYADSSTLANPFVINHAGQGAGLVLFQTGTLGTGGIFQLSNSANPQPAVRGSTFGTGSAGVFQVSNPANASAAINITHSGTGNAITANRPIQASQFIGDGSLLTGVSGLTLPYSTSVNAINGNTSLFDITYTGDSSVNIVRLNYADSSTLANPFVINHAGQGAGLVLFQSGTLGTGGIFQLSNSANPQPAVRGTTFGTGHAGNFQVANPGNTAAAINISHSGTGNAITANRPIQATQFIGDGSLLTGVSGLTLPYSTNVNAINGNTSLFEITYSGDSSVNMLRLNYADSSTLANPFVINHAGQGAGLVLFQSGTLGTGGIFQLSNSVNPQPAIRATTSGTGFAGNFQVFNPSSTTAAINITHSGTGNAITANRPIQATKFIGDGSMLTNLPSSGLSLPFNGATSSDTVAFTITDNGSASAAYFRIANDSSVNPAVQVHNEGTGDGMYLGQSGNGVGMDIVSSSTSNTNHALLVQNNTLGSAVRVLQNNNAALPALAISTNSGESGMHVDQLGGGSGIGLTLANGNASPALSIAHFGTGNAITANRPIRATQFIGDGGDEPAIKVISGGLQYNVAQVDSSSIATRSAVYKIASGGTSFAFAFSTSDGDTCIAFNDTGAPITVGGVALATGETRQLIYIGGAWRGL